MSQYPTAMVFALTVVTAAIGTTPARAESKSPFVVSYLLQTDPESWQWRVFDPATQRDSLFLTLPSIPAHVHWDTTFTSVEFVTGNRIERAPWRFGARASLQATLPSDSTVCDVWSDPSGRWHLIAEREIETLSSDGYGTRIDIATRWDRDDSGTWRTAEVDTNRDDPNSACFSSPRLVDGAPKVGVVTLQSLLDSMRLGNHRDSTLRKDSGDRDWALVWVASDLDPSIGLEMKAGLGDTYHAKEPIVWVNRALNRRETVYAVGQSCDDLFGQIAFQERVGFLLATAEFSGACPAVIDMRTGKTLLKLDRPSARAVWVPAPK